MVDREGGRDELWQDCLIGVEVLAEVDECRRLPLGEVVFEQAHAGTATPERVLVGVVRRDEQREVGLFRRGGE